MNEKLMNQLEVEKKKNEELFEKVMLLHSLRGSLDAISKHHRSSEIASFILGLVIDLDERLYQIDKKYNA